MSPRRLLLDDGDPSAGRADQSAAALHDASENSSANQQRPAYLCKGPAMYWPITGSLTKEAKDLANQQTPRKSALQCAGQSAAAFFTFAT
jgi:hypothetical protein